jgi:hypothetical protein
MRLAGLCDVWYSKRPDGIIEAKNPALAGMGLRSSLEGMMKFTFTLAMAGLISGTALAGGSSPFRSMVRVADSSDACIANCSNQADACKRVCPTTYNVPCLSACDSQAQTCRQGCRGR